MKILIVGSGAREHALAWKLASSSPETTLWITPGNAGTAQIGTNIALPLASPQEIASLARQHEVDLVVVGPEAPLVAGLSDLLREHSIPVVGPSSAAARLEGSKAFAKSFMAEVGIPTARFHVADSPRQAYDLVDQFPEPLVVKADGLASGKGVIIAQSRADARRAIRDLMEQQTLGRAGATVVLEEFLVGEEVSFIVLSDGNSFLAFPPSQDHKAIFDDDRGPNTGGMGAYCDQRILPADLQSRIVDTVVNPTLDGLRRKGIPFEGFLYVGLMMTADGPRVLEYNVRLGDPEAQALLHAMRGDPGALFLSCARGSLDPSLASWPADPSLCLVLAAAGYPATPRTGDVITGIAEAEAQGATVFHGGTANKDGSLVTAGGRVLSVTTSAPTLPAAIQSAYAAADQIHFQGKQYRRDIGKKGLKRWNTQ